MNSSTKFVVIFLLFISRYYVEAVCPDDAYEYNDGYNIAAPITIASSGTTIYGTACVSGDMDWYVFTGTLF